MRCGNGGTRPAPGGADTGGAELGAAETGADCDVGWAGG